MTNILKINNDYKEYNQYNQKINVDFSFLNKKILENGDILFTELNYPVKCREYLCETIAISNLNWNINTEDDEVLTLLRDLDLSNSLFSISGSFYLLDGLVKNIEVLREIDKLIGNDGNINIYPQIEYITDENSYHPRVIIEANKKWFSSPLLVSIYSLVIRMCCYNTKVSSFKELYELVLTEGENDKLDPDYCGNNGDYLVLKDIEYDDLIILLSNIDTILGNNPITGLDDQELLKQINKGTKYLGDRYDIYYINGRGIYSASFHNNVGLSSIMYLYYNDNTNNCLGSLWAKALFNITKKSNDPI